MVILFLKIKTNIMKLSKVLMAIAIIATVSFTSCKPNDEEIKSAIEAKLQSTAMITAATVEVKDGVATIGGECKDDECKTVCEKDVAAIKGVKSVINNCNIAMPAVVADAPVTITADDLLVKAVTDATKDFPMVTATVKDGVITLTGEIKKDGLKRLMPALQALKPKKVDNKLTVK